MAHLHVIDSPPDGATGDLLLLAESWDLANHGARLTDKTRSGYMSAVESFDKFLGERHLPRQAAEITRQHIDAFLADLHDRGLAASSVASAYTRLKLFFTWLEEEGEIDLSPMVRIKKPKVPEKPVEVFTPDELERILATTDSKAFLDVRDRAILLLLIDLGVRLDEITKLRLDTVDVRARTITVMGKGRIARTLPLGATAATALDRYLRSRRKHRLADRPELWIGPKGPLTDSGVYQMVRRRARQAGGIDANPHKFRHSFSHEWLASGGAEGDLMSIAGWRDRTMLDRYGKSVAMERAHLAHGRHSPADRLHGR